MDWTSGLPCPVLLGGFVKEAPGRRLEESVAKSSSPPAPPCWLPWVGYVPLLKGHSFCHCPHHIVTPSKLSLFPPPVLLGVGVTTPNIAGPRNCTVTCFPYTLHSPLYTVSLLTVHVLRMSVLLSPAVTDCCPGHTDVQRAGSGVPAWADTPTV